MIIGKVFKASDLGYYTRAHQFAEFPSSNVSGIIQRVTFPILCSIQDDDERLRSVYRRFLRLSAFIVFPLMIGLAAVAHPFILLVLKEQWEFAAVLLQIICLGMMRDTTVPFGIVAMCWGSVANSIIALIINTHYTGKLIQVGFLRQMRDLVPTLLYSFSMGAVVWGVVQLVPGNMLKLIAGILSGIVYFLIVTRLTRSSDLRELLSFVKTK